MGILGIFSNKKKPCPICGEATPRLLATKIVDSTPICSDCGIKISMVHTQVSNLSLEELKEHLAMREENRNNLEHIFRPNRIIPIGFTNLNIDEANKIFTIPLHMCGDVNNPPIFKFEELTGYELRDDDGLIERFHKGDTAPQLTSAAYEPASRMIDRVGKDDNKPQDISRGFKLKLFLANPCWNQVESSAGSITARKYQFQQEYIEHLSKLSMVTGALTAIMGVDAAGNATQSNADYIAEDIMKFKGLLDGGIITEEEFNAKKKQLLGI